MWSGVSKRVFAEYAKWRTPRDTTCWTSIRFLWMASEALQRGRDLDYLWGEHLYIPLERVCKSNNTIGSTDSTLFLALDSPLRGAVLGSNSAIVVKGATKTFRAALKTQAHLQQHQKAPTIFTNCNTLSYSLRPFLRKLPILSFIYLSH